MSFKYQWLRNGATISGATASTYKLVAADRGQKITVKVTGAKSGYQSIAKTSAATAAIQAAATSVYYKNCTEVRAAGAAPIYRGQPGYASHLDRDNDGVGCE